MIGESAIAFIFDLDGTLYNTKGMDEANRTALVLAVSETLNLAEAEAAARLELAVNDHSSAKGRSSIYGAALSLGVSDLVIAQHQKKIVRPEQILSADLLLSSLLEELAESACLALLTNTRTSIARRALSALGINKITFSHVYGGDMLVQPKPSSEDILKLCRAMSVEPGDTVSIGDRWGVDLQPALNAGLMIRKVRDRDDLVEWLQKLLAVRQEEGPPSGIRASDT